MNFVEIDEIDSDFFLTDDQWNLTITWVDQQYFFSELINSAKTIIFWRSQIMGSRLQSIWASSK